MYDTICILGFCVEEKVKIQQQLHVQLELILLAINLLITKENSTGARFTGH